MLTVGNMSNNFFQVAWESNNSPSAKQLLIGKYIYFFSPQSLIVDLAIKSNYSGWHQFSIDMPRQWQESLLNFDRSPDFALKEQIHIPSSKLEEIINRILHEHWVFLSSSSWPLKEFLSGTSEYNWGQCGVKETSSFRSSIPHEGKENISGALFGMSIPEPYVHKNTDLPGCGFTSQDLWRSKAGRCLTFSQITITHLHTAQCSPSKTGLHSETDTRPCWCSHQTAAQLAVLPLASCTGYSESALDPHKSDKRNDRLPKGKEYRKQSKGHIQVATNGSLSLNQNH